MRHSVANKWPAVIAAALALSALLAPGCAKLDGEKTAREEGEKATPVKGDPAKVEAARANVETTKAKTDAEKTNAIRDVLLAQTLRPDSILLNSPRLERFRRRCSVVAAVGEVVGAFLGTEGVGSAAEATRAGPDPAQQVHQWKGNGHG
jgi:hypothetical protein